jgi:hypothetical protein
MSVDLRPLLDRQIAYWENLFTESDRGAVLIVAEKLSHSLKERVSPSKVVFLTNSCCLDTILLKKVTQFLQEQATMLKKQLRRSDG